MFYKLFQRKKNYKALQLEVGPSPIGGRGVFAKINFKPGQLIEEAPVIAMDDREKTLLQNSSLHTYYFLVNSSSASIVMGLGYSSLYNHAGSANAAYSIDLTRLTISVRACKTISAGEEITINYNGRPDDVSPVCFNEN